MKFAKITNAGTDSRITVGYTYQVEHLDSGLLRLTSVGGKFSCLINPDTTSVELEFVDKPAASALKGWRNSYAVDLWIKSYTGGLLVNPDLSFDAAAAEADAGVALFKERWEGTTFLHQGEQDA